VPIVLKSGSLNLLEPSGPVQACNGIALPYHNCKYLHLLSAITSLHFHVYVCVLGFGGGSLMEL
jgi:hypothetical protein